MVNKLYILLLLSCLFTAEWHFDDNDYWEINRSSRASALGGIDLNRFPILSDAQYTNNKIQIYNSNMYDGIIEYNNILYTRNFEPQPLEHFKTGEGIFLEDFFSNKGWNHHLLSYFLFGATIKAQNLGFFNRKIENILGTTNIWNDEVNPPSNPSDIDNSLINYFNHNDYLFLYEVFFENYRFEGDFGFHVMPSFSKVDSYSSKSISIDVSYSKYWNDIFLGAALNNIFSYKEWDNGSIERFYPSVSFLVNRKFGKLNSFFEIDKFFVNASNKIQDKIKIGIEYTVYTNSNIRIGYNADYFSIGLGTKIYDKILFDYSYLNHSDLGDSSQITLIFLLKNKTGVQ